VQLLLHLVEQRAFEQLAVGETEVLQRFLQLVAADLLVAPMVKLEIAGAPAP